VSEDTCKAVEFSTPDLANLAIEAHGGWNAGKRFEFLTTRWFRRCSL